MDEKVNIPVNQLLTKIIERNLNPDIYTWLVEKANQSASDNYQLNLTFTALPRKTGKKEVVLNESDSKEISRLIPGYSIEGWAIDRLSRVWLLSHLETTDQKKYIERITNLFPQAEMNEQVALYSALPLFAYPEEWKLQCAIGIRSNIGSVLEAIMYHNPYPAKYLDEQAWNQLVLKAFFTGKDVNKIVGLDERANQNLADTLFDYVEERWSAFRTVNPQIWRLTGKFLNEKHFYMMERLFSEGDKTDQQAAALTCADGSFEKAKVLLNQHPEYKKAIEANTLTWSIVGKE